MKAAARADQVAVTVVAEKLGSSAVEVLMAVEVVTQAPLRDRNGFPS